MAIDVKALRQTMDVVERAAQKRGANGWFQPDYRCQTGMCFAGHGAAMSGGKWVSGPNAWNAAYMRMPDGLENHCSDLMIERWGLTEEEADYLFDGSNTLDDLRFMVLAIETIAKLDPEAVQ